MSDLIKYPEWQPEYLAAEMEADVARLPEKVHFAEDAIFRRLQTLASGNGADSAEEREALAGAIKGLQVLKTTKLDHPDW